jgi:hypothetical protein
MLLRALRNENLKNQKKIKNQILKKTMVFTSPDCCHGIPIPQIINYEPNKSCRNEWLTFRGHGYRILHGMN